MLVCLNDGERGFIVNYGGTMVTDAVWVSGGVELPLCVHHHIAHPPSRHPRKIANVVSDNRPCWFNPV